MTIAAKESNNFTDKLNWQVIEVAREVDTRKKRNTYNLKSKSIHYKVNMK